MNAFPSNRRQKGFTLIELLVVIAIIGVIAALLLPALSEGQARARRVECIGNLKELGVAFHLFAHEHNSKFPMNVPGQDGGSQEFVRSGYGINGEFYFSYRHFQTLSNELVKPRLLICPADQRLAAANFTALRNENVSYFVGVTADYSEPNSILAGDRNITNEPGRVSSIVRSGMGAIRWTTELHRNKGNVLFADARAEEMKGDRLSLTYAQAPYNQDFVLPTALPAAVAMANPGANPSAPSVSLAPRSSMAGTNGANQSSGSGMRATRIAVSFEPPAPGPAEPAASMTNVAAATNQVSPPPPSPTEPPSAIGFTWFVEFGATLVKHAGWWLLLLLLAAILLTLYARQRARQQRE